MRKLDSLPLHTRRSLLKIEGDYNDFVDRMLQHGDWEYISFEDFAVTYCEFHDREIARIFWEEVA